MKTFDPGHRARRLGTALLLLLLPVLPVQARGKSEAWARTQFSAAERMRETLNGLPANDRSRHEYQRVIAAYRRVYYGAPASTKADPSVVAVADLLAEMGRQCNDDKALRAAIGQYKFLRREYPGSRDRIDALLAIGQIYQSDLRDPDQARPVFEEFLRRYPHHHLADVARKALSEPMQQAGLRTKDENDAHDDSGDSARKHTRKETSSKMADPPGERNATTAGDGDSDKESRGGAEKPSRVTGVRHWSNPDYTRVAIDLERDTKFEAQRIDHPGRIVLDLPGANLASSLVGKSFEVDDGLLNKIRVAQFVPGKARIVLEVADHSDYDTFLLKNPPRLIVDIHNRDSHNKDIQSQGSESKSLQNRPGATKDSESVILKPSNAADPTVAVKSTASATSEAKLQVRTTGNRPASSSLSYSPSNSASSSGIKKTVVEADDDDDDSAVTVAKLDPPEIKPAAKAPIALPAPPLTLPTLSKSSARSKRKMTPPATFPDVREASPTASGDRSLIRALGLKIGKIVIDPGHGGHDTGTIGPNGLEEKDLVLDVGRRLGKLLQARLGADVVYTRKDDTFIPLESRTSIANQEQADLFVSIHANSSRDPDARGVETYYLNFTSSPEALDVAARENAASDKSIHELQDLVKKIALKEKIEESREFASNVQRALHSGLAVKSPGIRDRGVKKAPFIVLIGANMPSILAEISFVSNPGDERRLETPEYRQRIAESLYRGISKYVSGLSGVKVASKIDKGE